MNNNTKSISKTPDDLLWFCEAKLNIIYDIITCDPEPQANVCSDVQFDNYCSFEPVVFGELLEPESSETVHELSSTDLQVTK